MDTNVTHEPASAALRSQVQAFVRGFGVLSADTTPCGQPLSLSHAHALQLLLDRTDAEPMRQNHLARALGLDKSSVARLCARMEKAGHLTQKRSEADGRARDLELTAKGARVARVVEAASRARFDRLLAAIPPGRRRRVLEALELLNTAVQASYEGAPS